MVGNQIIPKLNIVRGLGTSLLSFRFTTHDLKVASTAGSAQQDCQSGKKGQSFLLTSLFLLFGKENLFQKFPYEICLAVSLASAGSLV